MNDEKIEPRVPLAPPFSDVKLGSHVHPDSWDEVDEVNTSLAQCSVRLSSILAMLHGRAFHDDEETNARIKQSLLSMAKRDLETMAGDIQSLTEYISNVLKRQSRVARDEPGSVP